MTYSLHTLQSSSAAPESAPTVVSRFANEIILVAGFIALSIWLMALFSYSPQDAAWSTSGAGGAVINRAGRLGAWVADMSYFLMGYSVWWCVAVSLRQWLALLAQRVRGDALAASGQGQPVQKPASRAVFWVGLVLLMYASLGPVVHAGMALALSTLFSLPVGDAALLLVLSASASYIVVPAVVRYAIPEANPSLYFGLSLGVTFPLNILVGIPLYASIAKQVLG